MLFPVALVVFLAVIAQSEPAAGTTVPGDLDVYCALAIKKLYATSMADCDMRQVTDPLRVCLAEDNNKNERLGHTCVNRASLHKAMARMAEELFGEETDDSEIMPEEKRKGAAVLIGKKDDDDKDYNSRECEPCSCPMPSPCPTMSSMKGVKYDDLLAAH